jgi:hypothetical protein
VHGDTEVNPNETAKTFEHSGEVEAVQQIRSREDFVAFVRLLLHNRKAKPDEWENRDLPTFFDALAAWVEDMDGYYQNLGQPVPDQPSWMMLGQMLLAAKVYE